MGRSPADLLEGLAGTSAVITLPLGILAFVFGSWQLGVVIFVVGWLLLVPTIGILTEFVDDEDHERTSEREETAAASDPLETLRERYARGEIDEAEFERRVDELLETDSTEPESRVGDREREYDY